jgi:hypothetical protein
VADLKNKKLASKQQQQTQGLANNAVLENACIGNAATTCASAISQVHADIADLSVYKEELQRLQASAKLAQIR